MFFILNYRHNQVNLALLSENIWYLFQGDALRIGVGDAEHNSITASLIAGSHVSTSFSFHCYIDGFANILQMGEYLFVLTAKIQWPVIMTMDQGTQSQLFCKVSLDLCHWFCISPFVILKPNPDVYIFSSIIILPP